MEKRPRQPVSFKRIGLCLLAIFVPLWIVGRISSQVESWYFAHSAGKYPAAAILPKPLQDHRLADCSESTITAAGFTFCVPWRGAMKRTDTKRGSTFLNFGDTASAFLLQGDDGFELKPGSTDMHSPAFYRQLYGAQASSSGFALMSAALYEEPSDVSWHHSRMKNARAFLLLTKKELALHGTTAIYPVSSEQVRGFQIGDPARDGHVELKLFDNQDREVWMLLNGRKHDPTTLTQPQINAVVASIHPAS